MGDKSFDDKFNAAWEKLGGDWFGHQWYELQRSKMLLGKLRTLREIEIFYARLRGNIAYSDMLRKEAIRHIKWQQISPANKEVVEWIKHFFNLTDVETGYEQR